MQKIVKATLNDALLLAEISIAAFLPAHGHSAPKDDINNYLHQNFSVENIQKELKEINSNFYLIYHKDKIAGYSKLVFNDSYNNEIAKNITYMSRLYLLENYYGLGLGKKLFIHSLKMCKINNQLGIWLKVWVENQKAILFYKKMGMKIVGKSNYIVSPLHSNPNYHLYLAL